MYTINKNEGNKSSPKNVIPRILWFLFTGLLIMFGSCSDDDTATGPDNQEPGDVHVVIEPQNAIFEVGEEHDFSAFLISASGDTVNEEFDIDWNWYSSNPDVFTVEAGGTATGHSPGEAFCIVEAELVSEKIKAKMKFVPIGLDSASVTLLN